MTTPTAAPGAVIDIKLSDIALDHLIHDKNLSSTLNPLLEKQKSFLGSDGASGTVTTGGTLSVALPNGQIIRYTGMRQENPGPASEGGKIGGIYATLVNTSEPNVSSSITKGNMSFMYTQSGKDIYVNSVNSKITSYQFDSLNASADPALGRTSTSYTGLLDTFGASVFDIQNHPYAFLSGKIDSINFSASKLIKSSAIKGDLNVIVSNELIPPSAPITEELPPKYAVKTSIIGTVDSYNASYYDSSYFKMKASSGVEAHEQTTMFSLLDNTSLWTGDDDIRIELPAHMETPWNINTGTGNDRVTAKGGGGELMIDTGTGDDQVTLLDDSPHVRGGDGIDTLRAGFARVDMLDYSDIENFIFTGRTALEIQGNTLNNELTGSNFADTIRANLGNDILHGLNGNDQLAGEEGDDQLFGDAGNDQLDGGTGNDQMWGGTGNDTYIVDSPDDVANEARSLANPADSGGKDTVISSINYTLGVYLENLQLTGSADISGVGNALANTLTGNDGSNDLRGEGGNDTLIGNDGDDFLSGGIGADIMRGGAGNDYYVVDNAADRISEAVSTFDKTDAGGNDTVVSSITFALADNFENLALFGLANINATGNAAANTITGNAGNNFINGKAGVDKLDGKEGSDTYLINSAAEHTEAEITDSGPSTDSDEVRFSPSSLPADTEAQTLTLFAGDSGIERVVIGTGTGKFATTSAKIVANIDASAVQNGLTLMGNAGTNHLTGTAFDDMLIGNDGNDVLTGGLGADKFVFNISPNAHTNVDSITDFESGFDQLVLLRSKFTGIGNGSSLNEAAFYSGDGANQAIHADDRIIFDTQSGSIYFDKDGTGSANAILIGVLNPGSHLSAADFIIADVF